MIELCIYVAGPMFSSGTLTENVLNAVKMGAELEQLALMAGVRVHTFVPHAGLLTQQLIAPRTHEDAQRWDDAFLRKCDALYRLPGHSVGTDHEVALAVSLGIPVFAETAAFCGWVLAQKRKYRPELNEGEVMSHVVGTDRMRDVLRAVAHERIRQEELKAAGKFTHTCADAELSDDACCRVLGEEFGEVCRALNDGDLANLREELVQVAAVAVAWVERIDRGDKSL